MTALRDTAKAKLNLTLEVLGRETALARIGQAIGKL